MSDLTPGPSTAVRFSTTHRWTTAGISALPVSAILLAVGTLTPQPDSTTDPQAWARFVSTTSYLVSHIATNLVGAVLLILGTVALAALTSGGTPRLAPAGLLLAVTGQVLFTVPAVVSTFVTPAIGQAYLRGNQDVMTLQFPGAMIAVTMLAVLLTVSGNVVLGIAVAGSGTFARWTGILWAAGSVLFYLLGAALGMATTGASLPTQPVGAAMLAVSGVAMARTAARSMQAQESTQAQDAVAPASSGHLTAPRR